MNGLSYHQHATVYIGKDFVHSSSSCSLSHFTLRLLFNACCMSVGFGGDDFDPFFPCPSFLIRAITLHVYHTLVATSSMLVVRVTAAFMQQVEKVSEANLYVYEYRELLGWRGGIRRDEKAKGVPR